MIETAIQNAQAFESLGIIGLLFLGILGLIWCIRFLYRQNADCQESKTHMNYKIGSLEGRVEAMEKMHHEHLVTLIKNKD